jgi:hypothetical protein
MNPIIRERLSRVLSPRAYHLVRYVRWRIRFCLPRTIAAAFLARKAPNVRPYGRTGILVDQLRMINLERPTEMCRVMTWHGSDKGHVRHNYTTVYAALFRPLRHRTLRIFELGLGTNNPNLTSSMGEMGRPGASLRGWRDLFPHALIYGADIDHDILFESNRIRTFHCDQLDPASIHELWSQPALQGGMDIIIDDGLHTFEGNICFLNESLDQLRPGGLYIVEDVLDDTIPQWHNYLATTLAELYPSFEIAFLELANAANSYDNNMLLVRRPA